MTGTPWLEESGFLEGPVLLTNTHSVGLVRDAAIAWRVSHGTPDATGYWWSLPVVAETWDGFLNDVNGFHVTREDVFHALETAHSGAVEEGSVGGGTGMVCYEFKGGNGTSSRKVQIKGEKETVPAGYTAPSGFSCRQTRAAVPISSSRAFRWEKRSRKMPLTSRTQVQSSLSSERMRRFFCLTN